jgi:hypothetical protein
MIMFVVSDFKVSPLLTLRGVFCFLLFPHKDLRFSWPMAYDFMVAWVAS